MSTATEVTTFSLGPGKAEGWRYSRTRVVASRGTRWEEVLPRRIKPRSSLARTDTAAKGSWSVDQAPKPPQPAQGPPCLRYRRGRRLLRGPLSPPAHALNP